MIAAKWIIILFGLFIISVGFLMLFAPHKARVILRKAGSTNLINYTEITLRLIPAFALILYADNCKIPIAFTTFGWTMAITSAILYVVPRKWHHQYSLSCADFLKPFYFQLISPVAILFGALIIFNVL